MVTVEKVLIVNEEAVSVYQTLKKTGGVLVEYPFIPQEYGFKESVHKEGEIIMARIYSKDGFNIARYMGAKTGEWGISTPEGQNIKIRLSNRQSAVIILKALGMKIDFYPNAK